MIRLAVLLAACLAAPLAAAQDPAVPEPAGYRMGEYRAPVPATLAGATVLDTKQARALWETQGALFIDVLPKPPKPADLPEGTVWQDPVRDTIPGATWLPNVGFGTLEPEMDDYFRTRLATLTGDDATRPVVFFCRKDCWMSWNAARRAMTEYGMTQVYWYPLGTEGWEAADLPLEQVRSMP